MESINFQNLIRIAGIGYITFNIFNKIGLFQRKNK